MFNVQVPGLAEHRPSLLRGDSVFIKVQPHSVTKFQGIVHLVKENSVELGFSHRYSNYLLRIFLSFIRFCFRFTKEAFVKNRKFVVFFTFNRYTIRVEHQAISFARDYRLSPYFFPKELYPYELPEAE